MARRRFPAFFEQAALALDFRPPDGLHDLPPLSGEQADFPRHEREPTHVGDSIGAPWADGMPILFDPAPDNDVPSTSFSIDAGAAPPGEHPEPAFDQWWLDLLNDGPRWRTILTADAIAAYASWHLHGSAWGVRVDARALELYARYLAQLSGIPVTRIRPAVGRQVLIHEWAHFAIEVLATELEVRTQRLFFSGYVDHRYGLAPAPGLPAPIEEVIAAHREVAFARGPLPLPMRPKPSTYLQAVKDSLDVSGKGYRDWRLMERGSHAGVLAAHLDLLTGATATPAIPAGFARHAHGIPLPGEAAQVPRVWLGDPAVLPLYGFQPKSAAAPTIARFERWLTRALKCPKPNRRGGKGSHAQTTLPDGQTFTYATSAGFLLPNESRQLAKRLGLRNVVDLYEHVARMKAPRKPAASSSG